MNLKELENYEKFEKEITNKSLLILSLIKKYDVQAFEDDFYRISNNFSSFKIIEDKLCIYVSCYIGSNEYMGDRALLSKNLLTMKEEQLNHYFKHFDIFKQKNALDDLLIDSKDLAQSKQLNKL